jgi:hypothetical protein
MLEYILAGILVFTSYHYAKQFWKKLNEVIDILQAFEEKLNEIQTVKKQLFEEDTTVYMLERSTVFHFEHCRHLSGKAHNVRVFTCCKDCHKQKKRGDPSLKLDTSSLLDTSSSEPSLRRL